MVYTCLLFCQKGPKFLRQLVGDWYPKFALSSFNVINGFMNMYRDLSRNNFLRGGPLDVHTDDTKWLAIVLLCCCRE